MKETALFQGRDAADHGTFLENGRLRAAGPFAANAVAWRMLDADTAAAAAAAEDSVRGDPLVDAGAITSSRKYAIAYRSVRLLSATDVDPAEAAGAAFWQSIGFSLHTASRRTFRSDRSRPGNRSRREGCARRPDDKEMDA